MTYSKFVHDHQFVTELDRIEPSATQQIHVLEIIEGACRIRARMALGYSFARIFWRGKLLVWYQAGEDEITLLSIRPDLM